MTRRYPMKLLLGQSAFSAFRLAQLRSKLSQFLPNIEIQANFVYLLDIVTALNADEMKNLENLLEAQFVSTEKPLADFVISPRLGTISPWSSKATDILHLCGIKNVARVERAIAYQLEAVKKLSEITFRKCAALLLDPMTESIFLELNMLQQLFDHQEPQTFSTINILSDGKSALIHANKKMGLALSDQEIDYLFENYSEKLQRNPVDTELMMFAQANSEHCRHKIFNATWTIDGEQQEKSLFKMIKNTYEAHPEGVLTAYNDNGAVLKNQTIDVFFANAKSNIYQIQNEPWHTVIKVETHNHPTAIAPFPGAATGSGGEIRDETATGRGAKPKAGLCGFSVSNLKIPDYAQAWEYDYGKPASMTSSLHIMLEGPIGAASFNNEFGRPNLCGYFRTFEQNIFDQVRGYHKPIMIAGGLGNIREMNIGKKAIVEKAKIIVLGGPTMKIGLGGGAASSMSAGSSSEDLDFASVQRENPEMQRRAQEVINQCWALAEENPILSIHDVGAGGLANAVPEIIHDAKMGGSFELRNIPNAEPSMEPLAIWCNEAQERFVLAIAAEKLPLFTQFAERERCPFAVLGEAHRKQQLTVVDAKFNNKPVDLPMDILFGNPPKMARTDKSISIKPKTFLVQNLELQKAVNRLLQLPTIANKNFLITIGDRTVGGMTARDQMVGPWQIPVSDVAVTALGFNTYAGEAMAMGERTPIAIYNPAAAARMAVAEAITNIMAADIEKISEIKLSANWMAACGVPGEDAGLYAAVHAVGMQLCPELGITIPVGKDSLSMQTHWHENSENKSVISPLSLIISAFAPVKNISNTLTAQLKTDHGDTDLIFIDLSHKKNRLGGSCLMQVFNEIDTTTADLDSTDDLKNLFSSIQLLKQENLILAYHDRSDGGLFVTLAEMCFAGRCGINILLNDLGADPISILFNEEVGVVLQVEHKQIEKVLTVLHQHNLANCTHTIGTLNIDDTVNLYFHNQLVFSEHRQQLQKTWSETSYHLQKLRDNPKCAEQEFSAITQKNNGLFAKVHFDTNEDTTAPFINVNIKPKIAILREQGINGQVEMAAAFHYAGFESHDVHMTDLISNRKKLVDYNGVVACGGFSYGDVLGAGKGWAKSILFNDKLRKQFEDFFGNKNNFALGVCNGCQMMSQLKEIIPGADLWPEFKKNLSEQFEARFSMVQINESISLFFNEMQGSQIPIVVSHGEGQAIFSNASQLAQAKQNNLICLQYVDNQGTITEDYPANPNGSVHGVTALTNHDGRVTIMMPHPERIFRTVQNSWYPKGWGEYSAWMRLFRNARVWVGK